MRFYRGYLKRFIAGVGVQPLDVTKGDISQFILNLSCAPGGKHAYYRSVRAFYRWLDEEEILVDDPTRRLKAPKVPKPIRYAVARESIRKLLDACDSLRDKLVVSLLADTGLRRAELSSITLADLDGLNQTATIWGKGAKQRIVAYGPTTAQLMADYLASHKPTTTLLDFGPWGVTKMLKALERKTGIKCNAHAFRRTFATESIRNGLNVFYVQSLLGHSSLTMTRIYAEQVSSQDAIKAYKPIVV